MTIAVIRNWLCFSLLLAMVAGLPSDGEAVEWQGEETVVDGVTHIRNPAVPLDGSRTITPDELWRLGGESDAEEEIFGRVESVLIDETGEVYFLDSQLNELRVFAADGEYLRTIGRDGEGPGEFRNGQVQFFLPENAIGVAQVMPARIAVLDREGNGFSDFSLPMENSMGLFHDIQSRESLIVLSFTAPNISDDGVVITRALLALDAEGNELNRLHEQSDKQSRGGPISIRIDPDADEDYLQNWQLGVDGRVYVAPYYEGYKIVSLDPKGGPRVVIERGYESLERGEEEIERIQSEREDFAERHGLALEQDPIRRYLRDVSRIVAREDGSLWVLSSRGEADCPDGALGIFDVFDPHGRYVRRMTLSVEFDDRYDDFRIVGDRLFVFKEANSASDQTSSSGSMVMICRGGNRQLDDREPEPFEIVCYELPLDPWLTEAESRAAGL